MSAKNPQILLLVCNNCSGMTQKLLPDIQLRFSENLKVLGVSCPSQLDPFAFIKLLKKCTDGVIVACPKDACCCPDDKKIMKRREIVKDILPVFGLHREQLQIASVSPFGEEPLTDVIEGMMSLIRMGIQDIDGYDFSDIDEEEINYSICLN